MTPAANRYRVALARSVPSIRGPETGSSKTPAEGFVSTGGKRIGSGTGPGFRAVASQGTRLA